MKSNDKQLQAEREQRELEYIQKLSEDEALKSRVKRLVIKLNDSLIDADLKLSFFDELPKKLGYLYTEEYVNDVRALWLYVGVTLALDPGAQKKKPRRRRAKAADDFDRTETGRIKGAYTPDGSFEPD